MGESVAARVVEGALTTLGARASGWWRVTGEGLELVEFRAASDMDIAVAERFVEATLRVGLDREELSIVQAVNKGRPVVAVAAELPDDAGSGYWLRGFGAARSIAVPVRGEANAFVAVVSVAIAAGCAMGDQAVAAWLQTATTYVKK
jgi:hypothetical protein